MSNDCSFNYHIANIVKSAQKVSAWILRTFLSRERKVMKVLLQTILVHQLEYACVVWSPFDNKHINMIENVVNCVLFRSHKLSPQHCGNT